MATSKNTKMAHIVNLMSIAGIDGNISEEEKNVIIKIAQDMGLTEDDFNTCIEAWQQTDESKLETIVPDDDDDKYEFLKNMVLVMMVDGEIEDNERAYIAGLAEQFGVDGEEAVDKLIKIVYDEYFADDEDSDDEEDDKEDDVFEDVDDESQIAMGKSNLEFKEVVEAFDELFLPACRNADALQYFLVIPDTDTRLFMLTEEQLEKVQMMADKGYATAQYVLGRYHQVVKPDDDSIEKAIGLFEAALKNGVANAYAALAQMNLQGYYGPIDPDAYDKTIEKAIEEGSPMALRMKMEDIIFGRNGYKAEPKNIINYLEKDFLKKDEVVAMYPYFYVVLGDAYNKTGNKAKAADCYEKAVDLGYFEAAYKHHAAKLEGLNPMAREMYNMVIDMECDDNRPGCFMLRAMLLGDKYEEQDAAERKETAKKIIEALEKDYELGMGGAATRLGNIYYLGEYGIKRDKKTAWDWFYRGTLREDAEAFNGLAMMVKDGNCPDNLPEGFYEWCEINAQRRSNAAPDKHYLAIIKPDGNAVAYSFIKDDWDKVAGYVGAKRLAPIRVDALKGMTAWVDIEAPRKGLPMNKVAKKFFKGVIAGDIILTQTDDIWDPMLFMDTDEIKDAVEALGGKLVQVVNDELALSKEKREYTKISKDLLKSESGFVARIQPDNTAHIVDTNHKMFALVEEDIYDPIRLESLYKLGEKLGLNGRLTIWTDNSALRKQKIMNNENEMNTIGTKIFPGPVADNFFVAMEDENYNIMLFDDEKQLKQVLVALGVKPENIVKD